jgi:REP element-mobilizing transposase RayT
MVRGLEARRIFLSDRDREDLLKRFAEVTPASDTAVYAWSLLTNHFHLLLRTGRERISRVMRRVLTGYAVSFNRRHQRVGHLFQNRFKSILVEEEAYFLQLVRYLHLNPLRARLVSDLNALDRYPWSGHAALMGNEECLWQDTEYVLRQFGQRVGEARRRYREFVASGIGDGKRRELTGGGLIRSMGGRVDLQDEGRGREKWAHDERVLGSSEFVQELLQTVEEERVEATRSPEDQRVVLDRIIANVARGLGLTTAELTSGSRRRVVAKGRYVVGYVGVRTHGHTASEVARRLSVSIQSVVRGIERGPALLADLGWNADKLVT